ncbi:CTP synthetase [Rhodovulum sp. DZ06]|uniref:CTP synthetase n=1 Tax=Rhodovulum sp. DZ06 TaxID=3425126 RepID=UPI003D32E6DA
MYRLFQVVFAMAGTTLAGVMVTAWLVAPQLQALMNIWVAAGIGFALGLPFSWYVAKKINHVADGPGSHPLPE